LSDAECRNGLAFVVIAAVPRTGFAKRDTGTAFESVYARSMIRSGECCAVQRLSERATISQTVVSERLVSYR